MKRIEEITTEIKEIDSLKRKDFKEKEWERFGARRKFLTQCATYLNQNPSDEFLNKERDRLIKKIDLINTGFQSWFNNTQGAEALPEPRKTYDKEMRTKELTAQLNTIVFILS